MVTSMEVTGLDKGRVSSFSLHRKLPSLLVVSFFEARFPRLPYPMHPSVFGLLLI